MMGFPRRRKDYEMKLAHLLTEDLGCYVEHVGKTSGWDLIIAVPTKHGFNFVPIEVKTSINPVIKLGAHNRTKEQLSKYRDIGKKYGVGTVIAYRRITRSRMAVREKWRFFSMHKNTIHWNKGITYEAFIDKLRRGHYGKDLRKKNRLQKNKKGS